MTLGFGSGEEQEVVGDSTAEDFLIICLVEFHADRNGILLRKSGRNRYCILIPAEEQEPGSRNCSDLDE